MGILELLPEIVALLTVLPDQMLGPHIVILLAHKSLSVLALAGQDNNSCTMLIVITTG